MNTTIATPKETALNTAAILEYPAAQESLAKGDYHQALLDAGYAAWQDNQKWSYGEMIETAEETFGPAAALFILLGKYNHQVGNGGHLQYHGNGFADGAGSCFGEHGEELPLHQRMIELFRQFKLYHLPHGREVLAILESLRIEIDNEREATETCPCCGGFGQAEANEKCDECGGSGEIQCSNQDFGCVLNNGELEELDDRYGAVSEAWMRELNTHITSWFRSGEDPVRNAPAEDIAKPHQKPHLKLVGTDGNAFSIIGRASQALREAGCPAATIQEYQAKAKSGDYDTVLRTTMEFCEVH